MENVKKKCGRKPKAHPQRNRLMIRLNSKEHQRFLRMFEHSKKASYSAFIADCVLNRPLKVVEINKSAIDYALLLSEFSGEFRRIGVNYNQIINALKTNFGERKGLALLYPLEKATIELVAFHKSIAEQIVQLREQIFNT